MTFKLVLWGWPNVMVVLTLAALPLVSLGLPSDQRAMPRQLESVDYCEQGSKVGDGELAIDRDYDAEAQAMPTLELGTHVDHRSSGCVP